MDKRDLLRAAFDKAYAEIEAKEQAAAGRTVRELWDKWMPTVISTSRGPNIRTHRKYVDSMAVTHEDESFVLGDLPWTECTPERMNAWRAALAARVSVRGGPLSPGTRDQARLSLQACFAYHVDTGTIGRNPLKGIPREEGRLKRKEGYFTAETLPRFLSHCRPVLAAILRHSARCGGMRRDEVRLLRKSQIDHETREAVVRNKGGRTKRVLLTDDIYEQVRAWSLTSPGEFVYANPASPIGAPVPKSTLWTWMDDACKASGLRFAGDVKPTIHDTRRTWTISMMMKSDVREQWISDQLGHTSTAMLKTYAPLIGAGPRENMRAKMNEPMPGSTPPPPTLYPCLTCDRGWPGPREAVMCMAAHEVQPEVRKDPQGLHPPLSPHRQKSK